MCLMPLLLCAASGETGRETDNGLPNRQRAMPQMRGNSAAENGSGKIDISELWHVEEQVLSI